MTSDCRTKKELATELNRFLLIDICWDGLSQEDLVKLARAFGQLRVELEEICEILNEVSTPIEDKGEWRNYVV